ncbi:MAG: hypothetical protein ACK521_01695 [bacterium]
MPSYIHEKALGLCDQGNAFYIYFSQTLSDKDYGLWVRTYIPVLE